MNELALIFGTGITIGTAAGILIAKIKYTKKDTGKIKASDLFEDGCFDEAFTKCKELNEKLDIITCRYKEIEDKISHLK